MDALAQLLLAWVVGIPAVVIAFACVATRGRKRVPAPVAHVRDLTPARPCGARRRRRATTVRAGRACAARS